MSTPTTPLTRRAAFIARAYPQGRLSRGLLGVTLVLIASSSVQISAVLAQSLFNHIDPFGVSGLRFAIAAAAMYLIVRPRFRGRTRAAWLLIMLYGASIAAMNVFMYRALIFLPLGVAITMEFLGPFAVAILASRKPRQALFAVLGLVGVVLIARPSAGFDLVGIVFGALAAASLAAYIVLADRVGERGGGAQELSLAFIVAAVATAPFSLSAVGSLVWADAPILAASALLGVVIAFSADFLAVKVTGARVVAVLLSLDPVLAAAIGAIALGERLDLLTLAGMICVSLAGGCAAFMRESTVPGDATRTDTNAEANPLQFAAPGGMIK